MRTEDSNRLLKSALELSCVSTSFRNRREGRFSIEEVSFSLPRGYILGIIGRNGAGKSTLMRLILQSVNRTGGSICVAGYRVDECPREAKEVIGYVGEDLEFMRKLTLKENGRLFGRFFQSFDEDKYCSCLERLEVAEYKLARELSKGEQMKAQLAFALSHKPELLLLDEPTGGLDPLIRREVLTMLQEEIQDEKMGIVFSTHITEDLDRIADYIAMLEKGRLLFCESKEELSERLVNERGERISLKQLMVKLCKEGIR